MLNKKGHYDPFFILYTKKYRNIKKIMIYY